MLCKSYQVHLLCGPMRTPWRWGILLFLLLPLTISQRSFPGGSDGKESACQCRRHRFDPWVGKIPWRREGLPTLVYSCLENSMDRRAWWAIHSMGSQRVGHDLATITHTISQIFTDLRYPFIILCFSFPSCMGYCSSWVTADTSFIQHTSVAHGVCDGDGAKSWWHRDKQDYLPLEEGKAFWDFFLFEVYTFFFWGLIMSVTFIRIVSLNLDSHAHNDFYANFPSPPLFLLIKL